MNKKRAFTLVELLVVITIIGILSSLITAGVMGAMRSAKQARIKMTMSQIELALEQYKNKYGEYPPDWSDQKAVLRHVKKRWPRIDWTFSGKQAAPADEKGQYNNFMNELQRVTGWRPKGDNQTVGAYMCYAGALAFWLGGLPDNALAASGSGAQNRTFMRLIGFSADPSNPFNVGDTGKRPSLEQPMIELERGKNLAILILCGGNSDMDDVVPAVFADGGPIIYFRATGNNDITAYAAPIDGYANLDNPVPENNTRYPFDERVKNLWHWDFFPQNAGDVNGKGNGKRNGGFGYIFSATDTNVTRFYPGVAAPYKMEGNQGSGIAKNRDIDANTNWYNPKSYQLVHPGLDGRFGRWQPSDLPYGGAASGGGGTCGVLASGNGVGQFDLDNIVNFGDGATIKALLP